MLVLMPMLTSAQRNFSANQIETLKLAIDEFVGYDQYNSAYFTTNNVLVKFSSSERLEYHNLSKGRISHVDISNPLMIVVFYADFNTIVFLDNQLNLIREIDFNANESRLVVAAAGLAEQNKLWIYDSVLQQLMLYDYANNRFRMLSAPLVNGIEYFETTLTSFKWIDRAGDVFSCNVYGEIKSFGKMPEYNHVMFATDNTLFFTDNGKLFFTDLAKNEVTAVPGVGNSVSKFYYKDQILAIFTNTGLTKFQITLP